MAAHRVRFPLGFYFNPTDADLLHHLRLKVSGDGSEAHGLIWDREIYENEMPCEFFTGEFAKDQELYFFTTLKNKFQTGNGKRKDRVVGDGFWRAQRTVEVPDRLGFKTMLNFFEKGAKNGSKWIMHEYTLPADEPQGFAVCRIKRARVSTDSSPSSSSSPGASGASGVKRKPTPLDHHHHNKRPHFSHPQSPLNPPDHPDIPEHLIITIEDDLDSGESALTAQPPTADHQEMLPPADYHLIAAAEPTTQSPVSPPEHPDDNDELARLLNTFTVEDDLDGDAYADYQEMIPPATADHQYMIPPADYHATPILDPPQATSTTPDGEFGETQYLPADYPEFTIEECDWLLQINFDPFVLLTPTGDQM